MTCRSAASQWEEKEERACVAERKCGGWTWLSVNKSAWWEGKQKKFWPAWNTDKTEADLEAMPSPWSEEVPVLVLLYRSLWLCST